MPLMRLLRERNSRLYLVGQASSLFGDSLLWLAMGIWVKTLTGSNGQAGLVFFFYTAPVLAAPFSGLLVDRVRRRRLLLTLNVFLCAAVLLLLLVRGAGQVWVIYLVMVLLGLGASAFAPAQAALLSEIVDEDLRADANAVLRTLQEGLRLVGPLLGSAIFVLIGGRWIAVLDAASFLVPIATLLALKVSETKPERGEQHWWSELTAGLRFIRATPVLRQVVGASACALFVFGFSESVIFSVADQGLHRSPAFVGVLIAVQGGGAIVGGVSAAPMVRRVGEGRTIGLGLVLMAAGALLEIPPLLPVVVAGLVLFGVSIPWVVVGFTTLIQRVSPRELLGRVYSAGDTLVTTPQTVSIAVGAALIGVFGYRPLLAVMGVVILLAAAFLLSRPQQRPHQSEASSSSSSTGLRA